jgi:hypothetical protein
VSEHWINNEDFTQATVIGRETLPLAKKVNPLWWFKNDEEPLPPADYLADRSNWLRVAAWYLRNPFQNAGKYVLGVYDRNYRVEGEAPCLRDHLGRCAGLDPDGLQGLVDHALRRRLVLAAVRLLHRDPRALVCGLAVVGLLRREVQRPEKPGPGRLMLGLMIVHRRDVGGSALPLSARPAGRRSARLI